MERWIGILIEQYAGRMPPWLAPVQVVVAPITDAVTSYAAEVRERLAVHGVRVQLDSRNEKISYKVREHSVAKVPFIIAIGEREQQDGTIALRRLGDKNQETIALDAAVSMLIEEITPPDLKNS
jgi:threonyl-tRNA synthetase